MRCNLRRPLKILALSGLLFACQTVPHEIPALVGGKNATGQMQYVGSNRSFIGEFNVSISPAAFRFVVSKGLPLISVQEADGNVGHVEFAGRNWRGDPHRAPKPVRTWLALRDVLASELLRASDVRRKSWTATRSGNVLTVEFAQTSERFVFHFAR